MTHFYLLIVLSVSINIGFGMVVPIMPLFLSSYGIPETMLGLPFITLVIGRITSKYFVSGFVRWRGSQWVLSLSFFLYTGVFLSYTYFDSYFAFILIRFVEGLVEGAAVICLSDLAMHLTKDRDDRGKWMGLFGSSFGVGMILGPFIGGLVVSYFDYRAVFYVGAFIATVGLLISLYGWIFHRIETRKKVSQKYKHPNIVLLAAYIPSIIRRASLFSFMIILPFHLVNYLNFDINQVGNIFALAGIITTVLMPYTGRLSDYFNGVSLSFFALVIMGCSILLIGFVDSEMSFIMLFVIETLAFSVMMPSGLKVFADLSDSLENRIEIIGYLTIVTEIVTLLIAIFIPLIIAKNTTYGFHYLGVAVLFSSFVFYIFTSNPYKEVGINT
ncbi:MFS transporter [Dasania sp. GY-MA-18]|uniref:MFS transporter n=1 Tax=Dasania phycosphaerae TaxID=2950436 RepID=A0A9J6RN48_9GAMM|nr:MULTISPECIES: MFS transporter [Dasania]MCR8923483.1 MFS transporter [Dasania sp. GY-MA-18]MCZ0865916.1 MFS transporter [Dasania phycosphaerae]MCZ0869641.1 MFS transporter [Dasania phycosphaerae]